MNRATIAGVALIAAGLLGYLFGIVASYPGRAFSVTAFMAGLSMAVIGRALELAGGEPA